MCTLRLRLRLVGPHHRTAAPPQDVGDTRDTLCDCGMEVDGRWIMDAANCSYLSYRALSTLIARIISADAYVLVPHESSRTREGVGEITEMASTLRKAPIYGWQSWLFAMELVQILLNRRSNAARASGRPCAVPITDLAPSATNGGPSFAAWRLRGSAGHQTWFPRRR